MDTRVMGFPLPVNRGPRIILRQVDAPGGECTEAAQPEAEVLNTEGKWMPVTVLAWHKLAQPYVQRITFVRITWLVKLRLADGTKGWYPHDGSCIRPVNESGSSSASGK
jgi:hypothetical protein